MKTYWIIFTLLIVSVSLLTAQTKKSAVLQEDQVAFEVNNSGMLISASSNADVQWPLPDANRYLEHVGLIIGAEVTDQNGVLQTIFSEGFGIELGGDFDPVTQENWGFLPLEGYDNPSNSSLARSDQQDTWATNWFWWPGLLGNNVFSADLEAFWGMHDRNNKEFEYFPYNNQPDWRGLGLEVEGRAYQYRNIAFEDITIFVFDIKNVSDKQLNKVVAGIHGDSNLGGPNNFADDSLFFDATANMAVYTEVAGSTPDPNLPIFGMVGLHMLDTPNNLGLTSVTGSYFGGTRKVRNDPWLWQQTTPGNMSLSNASGDLLLTMGSGYFSLAPGEETRLAIAIGFSYSLSNLRVVMDNAAFIYSQVLTGIDDQPERTVESFQLLQNYPNPFNPETTIRYALPIAADIKLSVINSLGQTIRTLYAGPQSAGEHAAVWNGQNENGQPSASGLYFYRLETPEGLRYRKMILMK